MILFYQFLIIVSLYKGFESASCISRSYGEQSTVCVCNMTFCDTLNPVFNNPGQAALYETNKNGARFEKSDLQFSSTCEQGAPEVVVDDSKLYQFILGFGGAFTDAAGININSLPANMQEDIINSYFSASGLEYNMGRVPIASCDFSTYPYSYDDAPGDFELKNFSLAKEDFIYKIPFIKKAFSACKDEVLLFGSPWSAPAWMKTNNKMNGQGALKGNPGGKYYQTWANYFVRFLNEYQKNNISFWGLTTQNEPSDGCLVGFPFQSMCFPPEKQRDFIKLQLGPTLQKAGFGSEKVKLMIMDDVRFLLPNWVDVVLRDPDAAQYVSGVAFHWYLAAISPYRLLDITHQKYFNVFYLASEACTGSYPWEYPKVSLGNWQRAERYAHDIIQDLLNWSIGWIDWNLALDMQGGPNWVKNFVDAPIIVNTPSREFYKQPMYYVLAHFSKFISRGSSRINIKFNNFKLPKELDVAAFKTPKDKIVVIIVNRSDKPQPLILGDVQKRCLNINVTAHSIQSYIW